MNKEILRLAGPNIISNISVPLLSTVDTALMGHLSPLHLGAVGISSMIFNFIYWNFGFLRMGTTGMTAQAFGLKNADEITKIIYRSVFLSLSIALILIIFRGPILGIAQEWLFVSDAQRDLVAAYFNVRIWAAPASLLLFTLIGWFFGLQNAWIPLVITLAINIVNIGLSFYFVRELDMGIYGVAMATLVAQYFGLLTALIFIVWRYRNYLTRQAGMGLDRLKTFFSVNGNLFVRTVCLTFAFAFFYSQSSKAGALVLASNVILLQFINWMSYAIDGFAFASESLVGKYYGAFNREKVLQAVRYSFCWGFGVAIGCSIVFGFLGMPIMELFSNDQAVIRLSMDALPWLIALPPLAFVCYIWDGIFIGFTATAAMRNSMLVSLAGYLLFYFGFRMYSDLIIWISLLGFLTLRGLIQTVLWFTSRRFRIEKWPSK